VVRLARVAGLAALAAGVAAAPASALIHLWQLVEVFSSADGSVQFVELYTEGTGERGVTLAELHSEATGQSVQFAENLPDDQSTFQRRLLFATPGFAALPGGVAPDLEIPTGFFSVEGDTISWRLAATGDPIDALAFGPGELPVDGLLSLADDGSTDPNSPTNFAGEEGSVELPEPGAGATAAAALAALAAFARRGLSRARPRRRPARDRARAPSRGRTSWRSRPS
jgi:hypothetical protein